MSIQKELENLYFHNSSFREIRILFSDDNDRSCLMDIDYYNWEGNENKPANQPWRWKRLGIKFGFLAHIEYSSPDMINGPGDIDEIELAYGLEKFKKEQERVKKEFPRAKYPILNDSVETISIKFRTQNSTNDAEAYIWVVGSDVKLEWVEEGTLEGQIHIPIKWDLP